MDTGGVESLCAHCGQTFQQPRLGGPRKFCGRSCSTLWAWSQPGARERRAKAMKEVAARPEIKALLAAGNARRWARPGERERLAERSRRDWADPERKVKWRAAIKATQKGKSAVYAEMRRVAWTDPEYRAKVIARRFGTRPEIVVTPVTPVPPAPPMEIVNLAERRQPKAPRHVVTSVLMGDPGVEGRLAPALMTPEEVAAHNARILARLSPSSVSDVADDLGDVRPTKVKTG